MGTAEAIVTGIALLLPASLVVAVYVRLGRNPGDALADWMLEAGGERKAHYRPLRAAAFGTIALALCPFIWFVGVGLGPTQPSAVHSQQVAGAIALALFTVAAILFVVWWWLSGRRMRGE